MHPMARTRLDSNRTQIGTSDLYVRPFVLGGNVFGWTADSTESFDVLDEFVARGGDFIDTADGYSHWVSGHRGGESETILGEWFVSRPHVRDQVVLATKVSTHPDYSGLSAVNVRAAADASLQRLRTNVIDLYYAHFDDLDTPLEETVAAFSGLVDAGKVRAIGVSNYTADRVDEWFRIARAGGYHLPVALEPHYNLMERGFETNGLRSVAAREHLAVFPYYALASGFLAGKYRTGSDTSASGASPRAAGVGGYIERGRDVLAALDRVAAAHGVEVATVALAWLRQQPTITAPIASARTVQQLPALLASMDIELSQNELAELSDAAH